MSEQLAYLYDAVRALPRTADIELFGLNEVHARLLRSLCEGLGVRPFRIDDLSESLELRRGRFLAVRWDVTTAGFGFKQPVMASLLLFSLWRRPGGIRGITTLTDGGNVNTCLALAAVGNRLGLWSEHVLSRHFPMDIREYLMARGEGRLALIEAPPANAGVEREFYSHLVDRMRTGRYRRSRLCLWHARYGGIASRWMGEALAAQCDVGIDDIVLSVGSGSTLQGFAIPVKRRFGGRPRIVVSEHEQSALFSAAPILDHLRTGAKRDVCEFRTAPSPIPHAVLGPHYDEINPFLPFQDRAAVDGTIRYSDSTWQEASRFCSSKGIHIGNSSAANVAVARRLASEGRTVLTFLYEPLRPFYLQGPVHRTAPGPIAAEGLQKAALHAIPFCDTQGGPCCEGQPGATDPIMHLR